MASGMIKNNSIKSVDLYFTYPKSSTSNLYQALPSGVTRDRVIGLMLIYTDAVFYTPVVLFLRPDNDNVGMKWIVSAPTENRAYTVRVFYI